MRLAIVVQRFGREILGGAETHARVAAGLLSRHHDVEVVTTTAGDYQTWSSAYPAGESEAEGVKVRRFPVRRGRRLRWRLTNRLLHLTFGGGDFSRLSSAAKEKFARRVRAWPEALQEEFVRGQGPVCPSLLDYLKRGTFDRVLFFTYLYPTTYDGLLAVLPEKAKVVPTLHDEPPAYLPVYGRRLRRAELLCSTESEVSLVSRLYPDTPPRAKLVGYGIRLPQAGEHQEAPAAPDFLLYAGRIDRRKGIPQLLEWYSQLRITAPKAPRLKLIGELVTPLPQIAGLEVLGVVSDEAKIRLMKEALAVVQLSPYESLGIVVLESMACSTPVIVNAGCEVMVEHCRRGGGGLAVRDGAELIAAVTRLQDDGAFRWQVGQAGRRYVEQNYSLEAYERKLLEEFPP